MSLYIAGIFNQYDLKEEFIVFRDNTSDTLRGVQDTRARTAKLRSQKTINLQIY